MFCRSAGVRLVTWSSRMITVEKWTLAYKQLWIRIAMNFLKLAVMAESAVFTAVKMGFFFLAVIRED